MSAARDWWFQISEGEREELNQLAQESILQLDCYPYSSVEAVAELLGWAQLEREIAEAHVAWLSATKAKFERNGWPWTTGELAHRYRLWEVE